MNENVGKRSQNTQGKCRQKKSNTQVFVKILARKKSKARSRVWIVQNNPYILET